MNRILTAHFLRIFYYPILLLLSISQVNAQSAPVKASAPVVSAAPSVVITPGNVERTIKAELQKKLGASANVKGVVPTPVAGIYEVQVGNEIVYTDATAKYLIQVTQGSNYQVSEIMVIQDGTNTYMTEFAVIETNGVLATFTSSIATTNAVLTVTMGSATSATINIQRTLLVV